MKIVKRNKLVIGLAAIISCMLFICGAQAQDLSGPPPMGEPGADAGGAPGPGGMPSFKAESYTAAVYVDGKYDPATSRTDAVSGGRIDGNSASNITISSKEDDFNGVYVIGEKAEFTLEDSTIELSGNGSNDFGGVGAGALVGGSASLVLRNVRIETNGCIRTAALSLEDGTLKVYDSTLITHGGILPDDYVPTIGPGMMEVPAPLGITGTCRTTNALENGHSYYYNTTITADGWGALSSDGGRDAYVETNNCKIQVNNSGYGTYADIGCTIVMNESDMTAPVYGGIIGGTGKVYLNDTRAVSGKIGFMIHNVNSDVSSKGILGVKGGVVESEGDLIIIKSANTDITLENAEMRPKNGVLVHSKVNEDPYAKRPEAGSELSGIRVTMKRMDVTGDIVHEDTERMMVVVCSDTRLEGSVKGASLLMDGKSKWLATGDSDITLAGSVDVENIDAPKEVTITATAGSGCELNGIYELASGGVLKIGPEAAPVH